MRALPLALLVLLTWLVGSSTTATAAPCPFHTSEAEAVEDTSVDPGEVPARVVTAAAGQVVSAAPVIPERPASAPTSGDAAEDGCCHAVAATALPVIGATIGMHRGVARVRVPGSWLPPHVSPATDIFRPPTSV